MKKLLSACIAAILVISMSLVPAYAAEGPVETVSLTLAKTAAEDTGDENAKIVDAAKAIASKYGVSVKYPKKSDGNPMITMNNIETLDRALSNLTPEFVRQLSSYYEKKNGRKIEFEYYIADNDYAYGGGILMAAFEPTTSKIYMFMPAKAGRAIISGENPVALVHEVGHAFHLMCMDLYGKQKLESEWTKLNGGEKYDSQGLYGKFNDKVFVSSYATTKYEEDFAEIFGHAFARTQKGTGFKNQLYVDSQSTALGKKLLYIENLIGNYIKNPMPIIENLRRIYKTPVKMTFEGETFYGENLQYIGYPQPKNILKGILNGLGLTSEKSTWIRSLGAWRIITPDGDMFYIFPGGAWVRADQQVAA